MRPVKICKHCKKEFTHRDNRRQFCSRKCFKLSEIGRKLKPETIEIFKKTRKGKNNANWKGGKRDVECLSCGKQFKVKPGSNQKYCSTKCMGLGYRGEKSHVWLGGTSASSIKRFAERGWFNIRKQVYRRDNWTCQICGKTHCLIHAHHIVPYRISQDDSLENLITLCHKCHAKEEWKYYRRIKYV